MSQCQGGECRTVAPDWDELCVFHWNLMAIKANIRAARSWESHSRLDPSNPADKGVLDFYEHLAYWAAKGVGEQGTLKRLF